MFYNKDGSFTHYALAVGYVESFTKDGKDFYATDAPGVMLSLPSPGGGTYRVVAHNKGHGTGVENHFEKLTEARQAFQAYKNAINNNQSVETVKL